MAKVIKKNKGGKTTKDNKVEKIEVEKIEVEKIEVEKIEVEKIEVEKIEVEKVENKLTLAEELSVGKDLYDVNTVQGCLNRAAKLINKDKSLAERFTLFPIQDETAFRFYKIQECALWSANTIDVSKDKKDYDSLSPELKRVVDYTNAFFSNSDNMVLENLSYRFMVEATTIEEKMFYQVQSFIESVHMESYGIVINTLVESQEDRDRLFHAADNLPCVRNKNVWMEKYMEAQLPIQYRRIAFAITEGIFFISSFSFIFYFRSKGLLQSVVFLNEEIQKDEKLHTSLSVALYKRGERLSEEHIKRMFTEAVELECGFVDEVLPKAIEDLHPDGIKNYVKFIADYLLTSLGHQKIWNIEKDTLYDWLSDGSNQQKTNFYEGRSGNYVNSSVKHALDWKKRIKGTAKDEEDAYNDPTSIKFL